MDVKITPLRKNTETAESRKFWDHAEKARQKVASWPEWKRNVQLSMDSTKEDVLTKSAPRPNKQYYRDVANQILNQRGIDMLPKAQETNSEHGDHGFNSLPMQKTINFISEVWWRIAPPSFEGLYFVIDLYSDLAEPRAKTLMGLPVLYGYLHGSDVPITVISSDPNFDSNLALRFEEELRGAL